MRVVSRVKFEGGPKPGDIGEAIYYRYNTLDELRLVVLFYGYPGLIEVDPAVDVKPLQT